MCREEGYIIGLNLLGIPQNSCCVHHTNIFTVYYPSAPEGTSSSSSLIPPSDDVLQMFKLGRNLFQLCDRIRIEQYLSKEMVVFR